MRMFAADETLLFTPVPPAVEDPLRVVYSYPNEYSVGITSLGFQLVWAWLAQQPSVSVSRAFTDANEPLPSEPHLLGFSLGWELDYANMLDMLARWGVPLRAADRTDAHPLVFGGGGVLTGNPEPYAPFFDVVLLGDAEVVLPAFIRALEAARDAGATRAETLLALAAVPGVYVPSLYEVSYDTPGGLVAAVTPVAAGVPAEVLKQTHRGRVLAASAVVSPRMAWPDIFMVEVARSCPEMCRFCAASYLTLPFRPAPLEDDDGGGLLASVALGMTVTRRLGLLGASITQHPQWGVLLEHLLQPQFADVRMSLASVRAGTVTPTLAAALAARGSESLTIAVESGSARVRRIVNKKLTGGEILQAADAAQSGGLSALKLYGMVGVPGEEEADVDATVDMLATLKKRTPKLRLTYGCSVFVPKPHTPFQWRGVSGDGEARLTRLDKAARKLGIAFRPESYKWSVIQALLSRGDRRIADIMLAVKGYGGSLGAYRRAFKDAAPGTLPALDHYVFRTGTPGGDTLPWGHLRGSLPEATLAAHAAEAEAHMAVPPTGRFDLD